MMLKYESYPNKVNYFLCIKIFIYRFNELQNRYKNLCLKKNFIKNATNKTILNATGIFLYPLET